MVQAVIHEIVQCNTCHVFLKHSHPPKILCSTSTWKGGVVDFMLVVMAPSSWPPRPRQGKADRQTGRPTSRGELSSDCTQSPIHPRTRLCTLQRPFLNIN